MAFASVNKDTATLVVKVTVGLGTLPKVVLTSSHGSEVELYLYEGCVTSWKVGSKDLLFVGPDSVFNGQKPWRDMVTYPGYVDCVYLGASNGLYLDNGLGDAISINNTNWPDVLWNPHLTMEA